MTADAPRDRARADDPADIRVSLSPEELAAVPAGDRDPVDILIEQNATRLTELVPVRMGRMLESPFAYYRGTAGTMAADLATTPSSGVHVLASGDAHIANFGFYASPERALLFDLNDFDEAGAAPWEWDLKRFVASVYLAARDNGESRKDARAATRRASRAYRRTVERLAGRDALERFYTSVDTAALDELADGKAGKVLARTTKKARRRTSTQALERLTVVGDSGARHIVDQPPLTTHTTHATPAQMQELWHQYVASTQDNVRYLLHGFRVVDHVLRVVGVGSVGTRCYIVYLEGPGAAPLFLQVKEAQPSVLATYGGIAQVLPGVPARSGEMAQGRRVVAGQRILQSHSDPFLGWIRGYAGEQSEQVRVDFYWRQFRDMKGSVDLSTLKLKQLTLTAQVCGGLLARAHAQSPAVGAIAAYCSEHPELDDALADFAQGYARQVERDFAALQAAADSGRVPVTYGV